MSVLEEYNEPLDQRSGSEAIVYKVRHKKYDYLRAVRVPIMENEDNGKNLNAYQRFQNECKTLLKLGNGTHDNIVRIFRYSLDENNPFFEMDYVDGENIDQYINRYHNCIPVNEVIRMATQISSALAYCHEDIFQFCYSRKEDKLQVNPNDGSEVVIDENKKTELINKYKVIHNDIHSGNVMRRKHDGKYILIDFGFAINGVEEVCQSRHSNGAPEFKAPEKWDNNSTISEQSDIYSFGILLYQFLAGRVPFLINENSEEMANAHKYEKSIPSIQRLREEYFIKNGQKYEDYPQWLEEVILKCIEKQPEKRFKNGKELHECIIRNTKTVNYDQEERNRLDNEVRQLKNELSSEMKSKQTLQSQLGLAQDDLKQLSGQQEELQSKLSTKQKLIGLLVALLTIAVLVGAFTGWQLYNQIAPLNAKVVEQTETVKCLSDTIGMMNEQLIVKNNEIEELKKTKTPGNRLSEINRLNETVADQKRQIHDLQIQLTKKQNEVASLNTQLAKAKKVSANNGKTGNATEVQSLKDQIKQKERDISDLQKRLNNANNDISNLSRNLKNANKEIKALQEELKKC